MNTNIYIRDLTKKFGKVTALDKLNLTIESGEFIVLLGPSGCGKTTLLRSIAGLEMPNEGEITIGDSTVFSSHHGINMPPGKRNVGMVFQSYALWPHMVVDDNIGLGLQVKKMPRDVIRNKVDHVLKDLSLNGLGGRYPSELSGGQQQRVALARLLASSPPVFLMDEPLSNLDARLRLDMRSELKRLHHDTGVTTVYVTHDQTEAMTIANRVVVMKEGVIQQIDTPAGIYYKPANLFVAEFVGMPRVNLLSADIVSQDGKNNLQVADFQMPISWLPNQKKVTAAIRPEDMKISIEPDPDAVECQVYSILPAGPEVFIQAKRGDVSFIIRETRQLDLEMDQSIWIKVDPLMINLYDQNTEMLLSSENEK